MKGARASDAAFAVKSLAADLRPSAFRRYRKVAAGQKLPRPAMRPRLLCSPLGLFPSRVSGEAVWAVTMIRDEADIICFTIAHLVSQGVDRVLVADNCSRDGSFEAVLELTRTLPVTLVVDNEVGYYQAHKMTRLARYAASCGAEWVIPFDADELWTAPGQSLKAFLRSTQLGIVKAQMIDYLPREDDDPREPNPYLRIRHHVAEPRGVKKVAFRASRLTRVAVGNHTVRHPGRAGTGLEVRHFPYRSAHQLLRKMKQGSEALSATTQPRAIGAEWRRGATMSESEIAAMQGWDGRLELDPAPYTGSRVWAPADPNPRYGQ